MYRKLLVCDHNLTDCGTENIVNWVEARHPTQRTMLPNLRFARYRFTDTCHSHTSTCSTDGSIERKCATSSPGTEWSTSSLVCADDSVDTCYQRCNISTANHCYSGDVYKKATNSCSRVKVTECGTKSCSNGSCVSSCIYGAWSDEGGCVKSKTNSSLASCSSSNNGKQKQTRTKTSGPSTCTDTEQWVDCRGTYCTSDVFRRICTSTGNCVECESSSDCLTGNSHCDSSNRCVWCTSDDHCTTNSRPYCVIDMYRNKCVRCTSDDHCSDPFKYCSHNDCIVCKTDNDCTDSTRPYCTPSGKTCNQCYTDSHCTDSSKPYCYFSRCHQCSSDIHCTDSSKPYCYAGRCVQGK